MSSFPPQIRRRNVRNRERLHDRYRGIRSPVTGEKQTDVFENAYSITLVYNKIKGKLKKTPLSPGCGGKNFNFPKSKPNELLQSCKICNNFMNFRQK